MSREQRNDVAVVGLGYIGLPTAAMLASRKMRVVGIDINERTVETVNSGRIHIFEPDLDMIVEAAVTAGYLRATVQPEPADAFVLAVPTPFTGPGREPDLSSVEKASRAVAAMLRPGNLVILESTSPVGTTETMAQWMAESRPDLTFPHTHGEQSDIRIAHCPERVLPGKVLQELVANDRVIGGMTPRCSQTALELYRMFVKGDIICTSVRLAEMAKLVENSFRDVNIAFANELSMICEKLDLDVWDLIALANRHPRVNVLRPGPGVGGHCIAVDPWFIVAKAPDEARLIRTAREVNDAKPRWVVDKVRNALGKLLLSQPERAASEVTLACYGLAFKPDIDDLRESPALKIVTDLAQSHPGRTIVVEPNIDALPEELDGVELVSLSEARTQGDLHVILVAHTPFKSVDWAGSADPGHVVDMQGLVVRSRPAGAPAPISALVSAGE